MSNRGQRPRYICHTTKPLPGGQYARGWEGLFLFIALARMVTFCKEGGGMTLALSAPEWFVLPVA